jgi:hypothetical protein
MITMRSACVIGWVVWVAGCTPSIVVNGYRVHSTSSSAVPSRPESYPHVAFEDGDAYLVGSEWIYRDSSYGWVVFDEEPPALRAYRERTYALETRVTR